MRKLTALIAAFLLYLPGTPLALSQLLMQQQKTVASAPVSGIQILAGTNGHAYCNGNPCTTGAVDASTSTRQLVSVGVYDGAYSGNVTIVPLPTCTLTPHTLQLGSQGNVQIFDATGCNGSTQTFTCGGAGGGAGISCLVKFFSGTSTFDGENGSATGGSSGSITLSSPNDLVYSAAMSFSGNVIVNTLPLADANAAQNTPYLADAYGATLEFAPHNMTSDSLPTPYVASASDETGAAYFAFDGSFSTKWLSSGNGVSWLCIYLGPSPSVLYSYEITAVPDTVNRSPKTWTLSGSNTSCSAGMVVLDTETNEPAWKLGEYRNYGTPANTVAYSYIRFDSTANFGDTYTGFAQLYLRAVSTFGSSINVAWTGQGANVAVSAVAFHP